MRPWFSLAVVAPLLLLTAVTVVVFGSGPPAAELAPHGVRETARLQRHFADVDAELRAADVSHLSPAQRVARNEALDRLARYAAGARFPRNYHRAVRTPVFIDEHGTRCAMAHLIEEADGAALVAEVARSRNLAYVRELAGDPALVAWLDRNGLTAVEAQRIQPAYDGCGFEDCSDDLDRSKALLSLGLAALNGGAIAANLRDDAGNGAAGVGLLVGGIGMLAGYGMTQVDERRELERDMGWVGLGLGTVSVALSLKTLLGDRGGSSASAPAGPVGPGGWSVAPIVGRSRGVAFSTRF